MYVPGEQVTSSVTSGGVHSTSRSAPMVTCRASRGTSRPWRARSYNRRPSCWMALYIGGTCRISPRKASRAAAMRPAVRSSRECSSTTRPSPSYVSVAIPSRTRARYCLGERMAYSLRRVACPRQMTSTPSASGSSVPACPTRATRVSRRMRATTSWLVGPAGL